MKQASPEPTVLDQWIDEFLSDLANANRSEHTYRAYKTDLLAFLGFNADVESAFKVESIASFFKKYAQLSAASRARKQATLASFCRWAYRHQRIAQNPMDAIERVKLDPPSPRGVDRSSVEAILAAIPPKNLRDKLLFRLIFETGLRIGEALALHIEDVDLTPDDEHLHIVGKGGRKRLVLLDDPALVKQLRHYLAKKGYKHGPLFRAEKNGRGGPLRYQSVQQKWVSYCEKAGVRCSLHQLRHAHATELINDGVSLATIRKRLGHKNIQTTLRYAEQFDVTADAELRGWRRKHTR